MFITTNVILLTLLLILKFNNTYKDLKNSLLYFNLSVMHNTYDVINSKIKEVLFLDTKTIEKSYPAINKNKNIIDRREFLEKQSEELFNYL